MNNGIFNCLVKIILASFLLLDVALVSAANLTRGPYLQMGTSSSVIVRWRSDVATNSRVRLGLSATNLNIIVDDAQSTTEHIVKVTGLTPKTKYYYSIGSSSETLSGDANNYFTTSPTIGERTPFRAWVIGDAGTGTSGQTAVYSAYRNFTGATATNLWLQLGDNAYNSGTDTEFQTTMFNVYPDMLRQSVTWPTLGNHDGYSADSASQTGPYYSIFSLPKNAEAGGIASGTEAYYSFDYANVHFVVLDSYETSRAVGAPMYNWLQADLQATTADWVIAVWHHPPYTKGSHNSDTETELVEMRQNYLPLLENYGVDLVLSGHSHSYERSKFIDGHYGVSSTFNSATHVKQAGSGRVDNGGAYNKSTTGLSRAGAVYAVAGSSGKISGGSLNHPAMFVSLNELGSMVLDVNGLTLNAKFINSTGTVRDYFTLTKATATSLGRIQGVAWQDANRDGIRSAGETLLSNIEVQLFNSSNQLVTTKFTDNNGAYSFNDLAVGNYSLQFIKGSYSISPKDQGGNDAIDSDAAITDGKTSLFAVAAAATVNNVDIGLYVAVASSSPASSSIAVSSSLASSSSSAIASSVSSVITSSSASSTALSSKSSAASSSSLAPTAITLSLQDGLNAYAGTSDTYVTSGKTTTAYGNNASLLADGSDGSNGRIVSLIKWTTSLIPAGKTVTAANISLNVFDPSTGSYDLYAMNLGWTEAATWATTNPTANQGVLVGSFVPSVNGNQVVTLNAAGIALVQSWVNGSANNGLIIIDRNTTNGVDIRSSEYATQSARPKLTVTYLP